jgi:hypothetical protein
VCRFRDLAISPLPVPAAVPAAWYAIPLRLIVGFGFMQHGYAKLARGPEDFVRVLHAISVPAPFLAVQGLVQRVCRLSVRDRRNQPLRGPAGGDLIGENADAVAGLLRTGSAPANVTARDR